MNEVWESSGEWSHISESLASSVPPEPPILNGELAHFTKKQSPTPATCLLQGWISMKAKEKAFISVHKDLDDVPFYEPKDIVC